MSNSFQKTPTRHVIFLTFRGVQLLDIAGPAQAFTTASEEAGEPAYAVRLFGLGCEAGLTASGVSFLPGAADFRAPVDTFVVPGGPGIYALRSNEQGMETIRRLTSRARRICAVCTGAFGLAEIGLLDGRRAVTHWRSCGRLAREYPAIEVDPDPLFIQAGNVWTSAGVTAGIDLALALIEQDLGSETALKVARRLVVYMQRSGGQRQYSEPLTLQALGSISYDKLLSQIAEHPTKNWTIQKMAHEAGQAERTFQRNFLSSTGVTPGKAVERIRIGLARSLLESTEFKLAIVAHKSGFQSEAAMRRSLKRHYGALPNDFRARFSSNDRASPEAGMT